MRRGLACLALAAFAVASADALGRRPPNLFPDLPQAKVRIVTAGGTHGFDVWIAADDASRARGLMNVRSLPAGHGMLFLFERPQRASFWMKDTYLSLDIVFVRADGVVVNVAAGTEPLSLEPIESAAPVKGVLEFVAGTAARIGLGAGDRVLHAAFARRESAEPAG